MSRTGLLIAVTLAVLVGGVFAIYPDLDLKIAAYFVQSDFRPDHTFGLRFHWRVWALRDAIICVSAIIVLAAIASVAWKIVFPRCRMPIPGRAAVLLIATLAVGPGLLTNVILKEHWGRPRPIDVVELGGSERFMPWWKPGGECDKNCSFVSGDASGAYWTIAAAAVVPAPWQPLAFGAALTLGAAMSVLRVMAGGHFVSDVFFAGFFMYLVVWLVHGLLYRWDGTRTTDEAVEALIERSGLRIRSHLSAQWQRLFTKRPAPVAAENALDFG